MQLDRRCVTLKVVQHADGEGAKREREREKGRKREKKTRERQKRHGRGGRGKDGSEARKEEKERGQRREEKKRGKRREERREEDKEETKQNETARADGARPRGGARGQGEAAAGTGRDHFWRHAPRAKHRLALIYGCSKLTLKSCPRHKDSGWVRSRIPQPEGPCRKCLHTCEGQIGHMHRCPMRPLAYSVQAS